MNVWLLWERWPSDSQTILAGVFATLNDARRRVDEMMAESGIEEYSWYVGAMGDLVLSVSFESHTLTPIRAVREEVQCGVDHESIPVGGEPATLSLPGM